MSKSSNSIQKRFRLLIAKAEREKSFRQFLLANPEKVIAQELGVHLPEGHEIRVHEQSRNLTNLVIPPLSKITEEEREAARTGAASLDYLKRTMYDPAPPIRATKPTPHGQNQKPVPEENLKQVIQESLQRGLNFIEETIKEHHGAWPCIRYNIANSNIPRHYEKPPFVTAYCTLALARCKEPRAKAICEKSRQYVVETMEYPGMWRYYRHLPQDIDSTTTCSLVIGNHPWILFGENVAKILSNRDQEGRFLTWVHALDEPEMVAIFKIETDPVVNANVIAFLGDCPETRDAQKWLTTLFKEGLLEDSSKWYPDNVSICYAVARAVCKTQPVLDHLRPLLVELVLASRNPAGEFESVLQAAQAITTLFMAEKSSNPVILGQVEYLLNSQQKDGSWPELLAFGDKKLMWGSFGQIGHASESMTTAFCVEALDCILEVLEM